MEVQQQWLWDARMLVLEYFNRNRRSADTFTLNIENIYVDGFTHIGMIRRVVIRTDIPDGLHYEVIRDGHKETTWLEIYKKIGSTPYPDKK